MARPNLSWTIPDLKSIAPADGFTTRGDRLLVKANDAVSVSTFSSLLSAIPKVVTRLAGR
jgi:hypothetical protein